MSRMQHHHDSAPAVDNDAGNMSGFDSEFTDIIDYILRITYRIWEGKQVGLCVDYYSQDCPVYTLTGVTIGVTQIIQNTLATLASFPDRQLHADNIVWAGDDQQGFHTSHLISTEMTNLGDTEYGAATGKYAKFQVIAHCIVKDNRIIEEWLVRDNYALVEQLGFDPMVIAVQQAKLPVQKHYQNWHDAEIERVTAAVSSERQVVPKPAPKPSDTQAWLTASLHNIWNAKMAGDVFKIYAPDATMHTSKNQTLHGHNDISQFYLSLLGSFCELKISFDYCCQNAYKTDGDYIAIRWTLTGKHSGRVLFGAPTGCSVLIIGESQYRLKNGKIVEEWTVFDELAVMVQIERARLKQSRTLTQHSKS